MEVDTKPFILLRATTEKADHEEENKLVKNRFY
jgi:hypothetical protein